MNRYLTIKKVFKDCVALLRAHFLYIAILYSLVAIPNYFIEFKSDASVYQLIYLGGIIFLSNFIAMTSIGLASSSFIDQEFSIAGHLKENFQRVLPFIVLALLGQVLTILGIFLLFIPGLIIAVIFAMAKIHFIVYKTDIKDSITRSLKLFKREYFLDIFKILMVPFAILIFIMQIVIAIIADEALIFKYLPLGIVIINPVAVCYSISLFFNLIKEGKLNSTNELV